MIRAGIAATAVIVGFYLLIAAIIKYEMAQTAVLWCLIGMPVFIVWFSLFGIFGGLDD